MSVPLRLRSPRDIRAVFDARNVRGTRTVVVHARRQGDGDAPSRVAVVAGRKVGNAVRRNRAKRRIRAALLDTTLPNGLDLVVTAKSAAVTEPFTVLAADVAHGARGASERACRR